MYIYIYLQNDLRKRVNPTLNGVVSRIKMPMLVISSDFCVCWQIIKRKPEYFFKKEEN